MAKDMQEAMKRHEALGLNPDEEAFYDALADRPEVLLSMGDATLKKLARSGAAAVSALWLCVVNPAATRAKPSGQAFE